MHTSGWCEDDAGFEVPWGEVAAGSDGPAGAGEDGGVAMAKCRSCGAEIIWIKTAASTMPCDPQPCYYKPDRQGAAMMVTQGGEVVRATLVDAARAVGVGYVSHFATCPDAARHKRKREPAGEQVRMEGVL